ncbi:LPS export ABC transporter permease LptF [Ahrensia sp. 13_GOM-1096m]|uniref:LPS export ABC transporter permease LptF n=1 Tax=Ahrensia sp. 13_GOM-1096m TaxID=1380380 RepID=UPI00138AF042|nr:LPS export ABC transporter permease LptF [Ahrensia sp. 13_GOM-1096m]
MNSIQRYIFGRMLKASLGSTLAMVALVWVTQAVSRIDFATGSGNSITSFLHFMSLLIPQFLTAVLPFGIALGAVQVLNAMNSDSEMPVLASAGIGKWQIAKPILIVGFMAGAYTLVSSHFIEPYTNAKSRDVLTQSRANLLTTLIQAGRFTRADKDLTIYVNDKNGSALEQIMISDTRDPKLDLIYYAQSGGVGEVNGESLLILNDGEIHRKTAGTQDITVIRFASYAISLSQFSRADGKTNYFVMERTTSYLLNPDPNDREVQRSPGKITAELHRRFSSWLYPVLLGFAGVALAGKPRSHRGASITNFILAFGAAIIYRGLAESAIGLNKETADYIYLLYLIPLIGIAISCWMIETQRTIEAPDWLLRYMDKVAEFVKNIRLTFARRKVS